MKRVERPQKPTDVRDSEGKGHGRKSEAMREQAILALLSERTIGLAAGRCGANERTLRRWMTEDATFKADYDAARAAMFQAGMSRIQAMSAKAVDTLEDLLDAVKYPAVRLGAARTVVEIGLHQRGSASLRAPFGRLLVVPARAKPGPPRSAPRRT